MFTRAILLLSCAGAVSGLSMAASAAARPASPRQGSGAGKKLVVFGGTGYVGSRVCTEAVKRGYSVVGVSRRGANPKPGDEYLDAVEWVSTDATDAKGVAAVMESADPDAVVHAMGLLFDVDSGLANLNLIVSGSKSTPGSDSTYDNVTRKTAENVIGALQRKASNPFSRKPRTLAFVSAAEAGWPEVPLGDKVEALAPEWLTRYLAAKRQVEAMLRSNSSLRSVVFRPSLIWSWEKLDVLPVIPVFNIANAVGVPFVDKTVRVEDLAAAIVEAVGDDSVSGVQRFSEVEDLSAKARAMA